VLGAGIFDLAPQEIRGDNQVENGFLKRALESLLFNPVFEAFAHEFFIAQLEACCNTYFSTMFSDQRDRVSMGRFVCCLSDLSFTGFRIARRRRRSRGGGYAGDQAQPHLHKIPSCATAGESRLEVSKFQGEARPHRTASGGAAGERTNVAEEEERCEAQGVHGLADDL